MEKFWINPQGLREIQHEMPQAGVQDGFAFIVLNLEEWEMVPQLLPEQIQSSDWLERLRARNTEEMKKRDRTGALLFRPHFDRLNGNIYYLSYQDLDKQAKECPIRCFLAANVFIMIGWNEVAPEHIAAWAQCGNLRTPLDLACTLGLRVLRHHQERLELIEDQMDLIEEKILVAPFPSQLKRIIALHRKILSLKRSLNAHQSIFERLKFIKKPEHGDLQEELLLEMTQAVQFVHQVHEMIESLREAYQAAADNRSNDIMKLLTLVATIILPISLLTGFFGMNFESMPFIHQTNGIIVFYSLSLIIILIVFTYFWRKKWLH